MSQHSHSTDAIQIGDAVEIAQWPCCGYKVGRKFIVNAMEPSISGFMRCTKCDTRHESAADALDAHAGWNPVAWLKKIERTDDIPQGTRLG